jgi:hypothetical protein
MSRISEVLHAAPYGVLPGHKEPTTSRDAARTMGGTAALLRERVLVAVIAAGERGLTPDETATILGESVLAIRPRFSELGPKHYGLITPTGERRRNESGLLAKAWRAT